MGNRIWPDLASQSVTDLKVRKLKQQPLQNTFERQKIDTKPLWEQMKRSPFLIRTKNLINFEKASDLNG